MNATLGLFYFQQLGSQGVTERGYLPLAADTDVLSTI